MITRVLWYLYKLRKNLELEPSSLREMQNRKLRAMLKHAYENVPFYHRKFCNAGIRPSDIKTVEDLGKVPITTKSEVQTVSRDEFWAKNVDKKECVERMTSGSTGIPLTVAIDKTAINFQTALWVRAYLENGWKPWHKMVRIADPRNVPLRRYWFQRLGLMQPKLISVFDNAQTQLSIIRSYKPDIIRGYPSCLEVLAHFCKDNGMRVKPFRIFTCAELLDKTARNTIELTFETELFDLYVSEEFGLMAWECSEHSGYHTNAEGLVVEFVKNGEVSAPGERGEVVCTDLINRAMPLIRYNIGDVGVATNEQCSCGRTLSVMKILEGRTGDFLTTTEGRIITPIVFFPYPFEDVTGIKQFRVVQQENDRLVIMLVIRGDKFNKQILEKAERNLKDLFGEGMRVEFQFVEKIDRDVTGKLRKIISHVPVNMG